MKYASGDVHLYNKSIYHRGFWVLLSHNKQHMSYTPEENKLQRMEQQRQHRWCKAQTCYHIHRGGSEQFSQARSLAGIGQLQRFYYLRICLGIPVIPGAKSQKTFSQKTQIASKELPFLCILVYKRLQRFKRNIILVSFAAL